MMHELQHHLLQFAFSHLPVADRDSPARYEFLNLGCDFPDCMHTVMNEIDLAAAFQLLLNSRLNKLVIPSSDHCLNGHAFLGRRFDHAHGARPKRVTIAKVGGTAAKPSLTAPHR